MEIKKMNKQADYTTFEDYYRLLGNAPMTDKEFEESMFPTNNDLSIEDISVETMKETQSILMRSFEKLHDETPKI